MPNAALANRGSNIVRRRCVVQVDRDLPKKSQRDVGEGPAHAGWQPKTDHLVIGQQRSQLSSKDPRPGEDFSEAEYLLRIRIDQARAERMASSHADELPVYRPALIGGGDRAIGRQLLNGQAHFHGCDARRHRLAKRDADRIRQLLRPFPQHLAAAKTEDAAPDVIEANWNYRRRRAFENLLEPAVKRQQEAGPRDPAFGENAN